MALLCALAGCAGDRGERERAFVAHFHSAGRGAGWEDRYLIRCPDVLDITITEPAPWSGTLAVGPDGRVELSDSIRPLVEGYTAREAAGRIADAVGVSAHCARVTVAEHRSQHIYLHGEVNGPPRAVSYRGPETVVELLQRAGGLGEGAAPREIQLIRAHVADGVAPEIFRVDLRAIAAGDPRSNFTLQPADQIYVGQSRRSCVCRCLPPWCRFWFEKACGKRPNSVAIEPSPQVDPATEQLSMPRSISIRDTEDR